MLLLFFSSPNTSSMTPHHYRKLLTPLEDRPIIDHPQTDTSKSKFEDTENPTTTTSTSTSTSTTAANYTSCCYNGLKLSPPFDSAMALTVLVLLTALFFMGFFSIYIRRFADESSVDPTRRRRSSNQSSSEYSSSTAAVGKKGVDPTTVKSLPVHAYSGGGEKQGIEEVECAICLSEFEEGEWVKMIPYCRHVFHVECIDTWLSSHVTCPLCRTANFFPAVAVEKEVVVHVAVAEEEEEERGLGVSEVQGEEESGGEREVRLVVDERATWNGKEREVRLVVDERDTWNREERQVGPRGERRSSSSSWFGERITLHRSLSF